MPAAVTVVALVLAALDNGIENSIFSIRLSVTLGRKGKHSNLVVA
jgi:hypothetical protein